MAQEVVVVYPVRLLIENKRRDWIVLLGNVSLLSLEPDAFGVANQPLKVVLVPFSTLPRHLPIREPPISAVARNLFSPWCLCLVMYLDGGWKLLTLIFHVSSCDGSEATPLNFGRGI